MTDRNQETATATRIDMGPPGFAMQSDLVTEGEQHDLIDRINKADLTPFRFKGWTAKRLTSSFGWRYDHDVGRLAAAAPMPDWLLPIRERAARFAGLVPDELIQALLTRYDPGAAIGWHRDRPIYSHIIGVSLGEQATMKFRLRKHKGFERASAQLAPRSIYHMSGPARWDWEHSIEDLERPRWSMTFRTFSAEHDR